MGCTDMHRYYVDWARTLSLTPRRSSQSDRRLYRVDEITTQLSDEIYRCTASGLKIDAAEVRLHPIGKRLGSEPWILVEHEP